MNKIKLTNYNEKDLIKVLGYEVDFIRTQHILILKQVENLLHDVKKAEEKLQQLAETLDKVCKKKDWHKDILNAC